MITKRIITLIVVLVWMFLIGSFSSQNGEESGGLSQKAAGALVSAQNQAFHKHWTAEQKQIRIDKLEYPVRKAAHMTEYGILGLLLLLHVSLGYRSLPWRKRCLLAWLILTAYAATDEIHQLFVPGRAGLFTDVCIDSAGGIIFLLMASLVRQLVLRRRNRMG